MTTSDYLSEIKKCVTFIFVKNSQGQIVPNGTGFFVRVPNETKPNMYNFYLVASGQTITRHKNASFTITVPIKKRIRIGRQKPRKSDQLQQICSAGWP